jgi:EPS-associated MarR family transcriptional regulator
LAALSDEYRYKILRLLENNPQMSQRDLARALSISLGKVNYCLQALIDKGLVKANNFRRSSNKVAYAYLLTPRGIEEKAKVTAQFLVRKVAEYEALEKEIEQLREYVEKGRAEAGAPLKE